MTKITVTIEDGKGMDIEQKLDHIAALLGQMKEERKKMNEDTQKKLDTLLAEESDLAVGVTTLIKNGTDALAAKDKTIKAQDDQITALKAQAGVDAATITADDQAIADAKAASAAKDAAFNAGIDTAITSAQSVLDQVNAANTPAP